MTRETLCILKVIKFEKLSIKAKKRTSAGYICLMGNLVMVTIMAALRNIQ